MPCLSHLGLQALPHVVGQDFTPGGPSRVRYIVIVLTTISSFGVPASGTAQIGETASPIYAILGWAGVGTPCWTERSAREAITSS